MHLKSEQDVSEISRKLTKFNVGVEMEGQWKPKDRRSRSEKYLQIGKKGLYGARQIHFRNEIPSIHQSVRDGGPTEENPIFLLSRRNPPDHLHDQRDRIS